MKRNKKSITEYGMKLEEKKGMCKKVSKQFLSSERSEFALFSQVIS